MAATIELLLTSDFEDSGFQEAEQRIQSMMQEVIEAVGAGPNLQEALMGGTEGLDTSGIDAFAERFENAEAMIRKFARAAADAGDDKLALMLGKLANEAKSAGSEIRKTGQLTQKEMIQKFGQGAQTLDRLVKNLKKASAAEKEQAAALIVEGKAQQAVINTHLQRAAALEKEAAALNRLSGDVRNLTALQKKFPHIGEKFTGTEPMDRVVVKMATLKKRFEAIANQKNVALDKKLNAQAALKELEQMDNELTGSRETMFKWGRDAEKISGILNSKFNQLGFAMFVTTSSFRNLGMIAQSINGVLEDVTKNIDNIIKASITLDTSLQSVGDTLGDVDEASRGWLNATTLVADYGKAVRSSAEDINQELLPAVAAASRVFEASGIVDSAQEAGKALLKGLGGDVSAVNELFPEIAAAIQTAKDKSELFNEEFDETGTVARLVAERIQDVADAGEDLDLAADKIKEMKGDFELVSDALKIGLIASLGQLLGDLKTLSSLLSGTDQTMREFAANVVAAMTLLGESIKQLVLATFRLILGSLVGTSSGIAKMAIHIGEAMGMIDSSKAEEALLRIEETSDMVGSDLLEQTQDVVIELGEAWRKGRELGNEAFIGLGDDAEEAAARIAAALDPANIYEPTAGEVSAISNIRQQLEANLAFLQSDELKLANDLQDARNNLYEKLGELDANAAKDALEARAEHIKDILEMEKEAAKEEIDIREDLVDKLLEIDSTLNLKLDRMREDFDDRQERERKKSKKKIEDIEEDHQKKLDDIMRKFELSRLKALIDRDARALFEAERRRDEELRKANETAEEKKKDEEEARKEREKLQQQDLDKALARAEEDAEIKRQKARDAMQDEVDDLRENLAEAKAERDDNLLEELKDIEDNAEERRTKLKKAYRKQEADLSRHYLERKRITDLQAAISTAELLGAWTGSEQEFRVIYSVLEGDLRDFRDTAVEIAGEIAEAVSQISGGFDFGDTGFNDTGGGDIFSGGGGGNDDGGFGPCSGTADLFFVPTEDAGCANRVATKLYKAPDCSLWRCINMRWTRGTGHTTGSDLTQQSTEGIALSQNSPGGTGSVQGAVVTLQTNDPGLDQYLTDTAYTVIVDLYGE